MVILRKRQTHFKSITLLLLFVLSSISTLVLAQNAELIARVDREQISIEETFHLSLRYKGKTSEQPDFSLLQENFVIRNQGTSSQTNIINGRAESTIEWNLLLEPRREGKLLIPSFQLGNVFSDAIEIEVSPPAPPPKGTLRDLFLETIVDKSSAYVQEQIKVTYRLYFSVGVESLEVDPFNLTDVVIEALPETIYQRNVSGKDYRVAEYSYAFFPQSSGELKIPQLNWRVGVQLASNQRDFFGRPLARTELKRLRSDEKLLTIKPKPDAFPANAVWLPATKLKLSETWSSEEFRVGEPVTRNLTTIAEGLRVEQLPSFLNSESIGNNIKFYSDQPQTVDDKNAQGFVAKRVESAAVVISEPGEVDIPAIRVPWWNVNEDKLMYAEVPARRVRVEGTASSATTTSASNAGSQAVASPSGEATDILANNEEFINLKKQLLITQVLLAISILACTTLLVFYFLGRKKSSLVTTGKEKFTSSQLSPSTKALLKLCESASANEVRKQILLWSKQHWPNEDIQTLVDIARLGDNTRLKDELLKLDACLYRSDKTESWNGHELAVALKDVLNKQAEAAKNHSELAGLY